MHKVFPASLVAALVVILLFTGCGSSPAPSPSPSSSAPAVTTTTTSSSAPASTAPAATTSAAPATTTSTPTAAPGTPAPTASAPADSTTTDLAVAGRTAGMFTDLVYVQNYYTDGLNEMATLDLASSSRSAIAARPGGSGVMPVSWRPVAAPVATAYGGKLENVPSELLAPLPSGGAMAAQPGACPGGARPEVTFENVAGVPVTPELIAEKGIRTMPSDLVTVPETDPSSLMNLMMSLIPMGDQSLASPAYWDTILWEPLKSSRVPVESLMDYQVWTTADELEQIVVARLRAELAAGGAPPPVLDAFDRSSTSGWYANTPATPSDDLAGMDIDAEMTGSVNGMVHEQRDFTIPGLGQPPIYGVQTGDGVVTGDVPDIGPVDFSVDITLDQYDALGRAIGGVVNAVALQDAGYQVVFTFLPDGTKEGVVTKDGEKIGELTMAVDHEKFENYIDVKQGTTMSLPEFSTAG
jgi:hypothetical protein